MIRRFNLMLMVLLATVLMSSNAAWPLDRFVDLKDGTMLDTVSSLRWLKNANCYGLRDWYTAVSTASGLSSPSCGLTDGSTAGDWHLPTLDELRIFTNAGYIDTSLNTAGFSTVQPTYWSSSSVEGNSNIAWYVSMGYGGANYFYKTNNLYVWPVRGGQYWTLDSLVILGAVDFGSVPVGSVSPGHQFILNNSGTTTKLVTSIVLGGTNPTQFTLTTGGSAPCSSLTPTLAAGESCTVVVSAKATSLGSKSANLTVTSGGLSVNAPLSATTHLAVIYNGNGSNSGSVPTDSIKYPLNATVTVLGKSGTLAKSGYVFNGWNTAADASSSTYQTGATFAISTPVTLYAIWTAPLAPPSGLISWWRGEGNGIDSSGGLTGTPSAGMGYTAGKVGQAFSLNGSTANMIVPDNPKMRFGTNEFSMAAWIKTTDTRDWQRVVTKRASSGYDYWYSLFVNQGYVCFEIAGGGANFSSNAFVADGAWHQIAVTRDPATVSPRKYRLYVDGVEKNSGDDGGLMNLDNTGPLEIGKWSTETYGGIYSGLIDEVQIFNRSLTTTEIQSIYNAGSAGLAPPPTVTAVSPLSGPATGGASVTISGSGLNSATAVQFGTTAATSFTVNSDTQITAVAPAGTGGTVDVTVTTRGGTTATSSADQFTYVRFIDLNDGTMLDTVSSLRWLKNANCNGWQDWYTHMSSAAGLSSPSCGLTDGSITGDWHLPTIAELRIFTDAGYRTDTLNAAGFITVETSYWSSSSYANGTDYAWFVFMDTGDVNYGNKTNSNYVWPVRGGKYWTLDSLVVVGIADFGNQTVSSVSPGHQFLLKNVGVTPSSVTSIALGGSNADQFTVASGGAKPCVTLAPTLAAGASCTVIVTAHPTSIGSKSATLTVATASGSKDIPLTASAFYLPTVTAITPNSGSFSGGTTVTINGSNLAGASSVAFSTNIASNVIVISDSQISAVSPAGATGQTVDITVTTQGGTSVTNSADQFTYKTIAARNMTSSTISSLDDALSAAKPGEEIRTLAITLPGNFNLSRNQILNGGYDGDYLNTTVVPTTLNGSLTVTSGASTVESLVVKGKLALQGGSLRVKDVMVIP